MAIPTLTDAADIVEINDNAASGSQSVTVPSDATLCVAFMGFYPTRTFTSATLGGSSMTFEVQGADGGQVASAFWIANPSTGSQTFAWTYSSSFDEGAIITLVFFKGVDTSGSVIRDSAEGGTTTASFDTSTDDLCVCAVSVYAETGDASTGGQTEIYDAGTYNSQGLAIGTKDGTSGTTTMQGSGGTSESTIALSIIGITATLDQEGFAWGDDDGSESAHTIGTQDTNYTGAVGTKILRMIVDNVTGDAGANLYPLYYQQDGSGGYTAVPVGASSDPTTPGVEAGDVTRSGSNATSTTIAMTMPAYADGDLVTVNIGYWQNNNQTNDITWPSGPNGETVTSVVTNYGGSGNYDIALIALGWFIGDGAYAGGTWNITADIGTRWDGAIIITPSGEFDASTPIGATGSDFSSTDDNSPTMPAFTAGSADGDGTLVAFVSVDQDPISGTPTGWTDLVDHDQGRASIVLSVRDTAVTNSESVSSASWTVANDSWAVYGYIIRPAPGADNDVYIVASSNITDGAATTARLTAPSGKTGDFTAGICSDADNVSATVDITALYYTEMLYVIAVTSNMTGYVDFRTYNGASPLDSYTATPRWTIGSGGISGTLSATLANTTSTAAGTVAIDGTASNTLNDATLSAAGTVEVNGALSATLADVTLTAAGQGAAATEGTLDVTLGDVTAVSAGTVLVSGTTDNTLGDATLTAAGTVSIGGELDATLVDVTSTAAGTVVISGALDSTLEGATSTAAGTVSLSGALSATLEDVTLVASGSGAAVTTGELSATLGDVTAVSAGTILVDGVLSSTLEDASITAAGVVSVAGAVDSTLGNVTAVSVGTVTISGALSSTIDDVTATGAGIVSIGGALDSTLGNVTLTATAEAFSAVVGAYGIIYGVGSDGVIFSPDSVGAISQPISVGTIEQPSYIGDVEQPSNIGTVITDRHG
jgi:hypothetical protein